MSDGRNLKSDIYNLNLNIYLNMYSYLILQHLNMETTMFSISAAVSDKDMIAIIVLNNLFHLK